MATYENYLEYIKTEFSKINPNELSEDEKEYYEVVKRDLENSNTLPSRILKSPVLPKEHLNNETMNEPRRKRTGYHPLKSHITYNLLLTPQSGGVLDPR